MMEASSDSIPDYESSSDEIFFGNIGVKETKISERLLRRRTLVFTESFREHKSVFETSAPNNSIVEENEIEQLSSFMEDSLNLVQAQKLPEQQINSETSPSFTEDSLNVDRATENIAEDLDDDNKNRKLPSLSEDSLNPVEISENLELSFNTILKTEVLDSDEDKIVEDTKDHLKTSFFFPPLQGSDSLAVTTKLELSLTEDFSKMVDEKNNSNVDCGEKKVDDFKKLKQSFSISAHEEIDNSFTTKLELSQSSYQDSGILNLSKEQDAYEVDMNESLPILKLNFDSPKNSGDNVNLLTKPGPSCSLESHFINTPDKNEDYLNDTLSSPEADFFNLDRSNDEIIECSSREVKPPSPPSYLINVLDLSRDMKSSTIMKNPSNEWEKTSTPANSLASLNLHSSIRFEEDKKENQSPQALEFQDSREGIKHAINDETNKQRKKARNLYWSPQTVSNPVRSNIPIPIGSSGKPINRGLSSKKSLKKWDVVSPVGQYIRERPLPPLFKNFKPLNELPLSKTANAMAFHIKDITPIKQDKSPTISKLPPAEYESSSQKMEQNVIRTSPGNRRTPLIIRHKGPSKAIYGATHLLSNESLCLANKMSKTSEKKISDINKSVMEVVQLQRTNTIFPTNMKN